MSNWELPDEYEGKKFVTFDSGTVSDETEEIYIEYGDDEILGLEVRELSGNATTEVVSSHAENANKMLKEIVKERVVDSNVDKFSTFLEGASQSLYNDIIDEVVPNEFTGASEEGLIESLRAVYAVDESDKTDKEIVKTLRENFGEPSAASDEADF